MTETTDSPARDSSPRTGHYDHPKNIQIGQGRVIYADHRTFSQDQHHEPGWVLPGGMRTQDEFVARGMARRIDNCMKTGNWE